MKQPHKHADLIKAWADGATIQSWSVRADGWVDLVDPNWAEDIGFRIKPEPAPDVALYLRVGIEPTAKPKQNNKGFVYEAEDIVTVLPSTYSMGGDNLQLLFDGETGKLKSAEVIS